MFNFIKKFSINAALRKFSSKQCPAASTTTTTTTQKFRHKDGGYKTYKYLTFFLGIPAILAAGAMTCISKMNRGCEERQPFVPYEFLRRRTKRFPWGEGNKSLFHNPELNALPDGYEVEQKCDEGEGSGEQHGGSPECKSGE